MELGLCDKVEIYPERTVCQSTGTDRLVYPLQQGVPARKSIRARQLLLVAHAAHPAPLTLGHQRIELVIVHQPQATSYDALKELLE